MKTVEALKEFDSAAELARELGISRQSISSWKKIVPYHWQPVLEKLRPGKLKAMQPREFAAYRRSRHG